MTAALSIRPETLTASVRQVPTMLRYFARRGADCIVKEAEADNGTKVRVMRPDGFPGWRPPDGDPRFVVQEVVHDPLLLAGHKSDLRCHVMIDVDDRQRCRMVSPVLMRRAGVPYVRGWDDSEITNVNYQHRTGLPAEIRPIEEWEVLPSDLRAEMLTGLQALMNQLLDAHRWWTECVAPRDRWTSRRVLLWGIDVLPARGTDGALKLNLLEINVYAQLHRPSSPSSNEMMAAMLAGDYLPAMLAHAGVQAPA